MASRWFIATCTVKIGVLHGDSLNMLTIHQAQAPNQTQSQPKTGLAIAGGGPLGAIYELGALRALDESVDGLKLHELDVYVGVSSGALIAAGVANRMTTG